MLEDVLLDPQFREERRLLSRLVVFGLLHCCFLGLGCFELLSSDTAFQLRSQSLSESGEDSLQCPGQQDTAENVTGSSGERRKLEGVVAVRVNTVSLPYNCGSAVSAVTSLRR